MWIFQLTHAVQTCIVQRSTGSWESMYGESQLKLFMNFWLQEWSSSLTPTLFKGQLYLLRDVISSGLSVFFPIFGSFGVGPKILGGVDVVFLPSSSYFSYDHTSSSRNKSEDNTQESEKGRICIWDPVVVFISKFKITMTAEKSTFCYLSNL